MSFFLLSSIHHNQHVYISHKIDKKFFCFFPFTHLSSTVQEKPKWIKKIKTKRTKKIDISGLKIFTVNPCNFAPANFCRSCYQIQYSIVEWRAEELNHNTHKLIGTLGQKRNRGCLGLKWNWERERVILFYNNLVYF